MAQRTLSFQNFDEVHAEVDRLHLGGYEKGGNWDLAQVCDHLRYFMEGSLDGWKFKVPWLIKTMFGKMALNGILTRRKMKAGVFTPHKPLPEPGGDEAVAAAKFKQVMERVKSHPGGFHDSPFFGHMTPEQWRELHLIHCGHHLGFLMPKG
jgi:hypothetical protein